MKQVTDFLELGEAEYFGIAFNHPKQRDQLCWLQNRKQISKQIGSGELLSLWKSEKRIEHNSLGK